MGIVSLVCVQGQAQIDEKLPPRKQTKIERYCSVFIEQFVILIFIGGILGLCAFFVPITDENKFRLKGAFVCMIVFCMIFTIPVRKSGKLGCVFPIMVRSEFRMRRYRDEGNREDSPLFRIWLLLDKVALLDYCNVHMFDI